ncbi:BgTH12-00443, partial [Blumeria graminis f. sp. triticale]
FKFQTEVSSYIVVVEASLLRIKLFECRACAHHE